MENNNIAFPHRIRMLCFHVEQNLANVYIAYLMQIDLLTKNRSRDKSKNKGLQAKILGTDPGSYKKRWERGGQGKQTFPKIRTGFHHLLPAFDVFS